MERDIEYRYIRKNGRKYGSEKKSEIIRYSVNIPYFQAKIDDDKIVGKLNEFYGGILDNCLEYCEGEGLEALYSKRSGDGESMLIYSFDSKVTYIDEAVISVISQMYLFERIKKKGSIQKEKLDEFRRGQVFSLSDGFLIPPRIVVRRYGNDEKIKYNVGSSVIISNGHAAVL